MSDRSRVLAVRAVLGLLLTVTGAFMLSGCPVGAQPPLAPRAADTVTVPAVVPGR
jgi:hypothetical protein